MSTGPSFTSSRLFLRGIEPGDATGLYRYRSDKETNRYQGWIPETEKEAMDFIRKSASTINQPDSWFQLVIIEQSSDKLIGDIGLHFLEDDKQVEIGCTLDRNFQGKGYATEALKVVVDYLFNELDKHRITGSVDPANTASIALMERLSFRKEAHFKESLFIDGKWVDDVIYALLKSEWQ